MLVCESALNHSQNISNLIKVQTHPWWLWLVYESWISLHLSQISGISQTFPWDLIIVETDTDRQWTMGKLDIMFQLLSDSSSLHFLALMGFEWWRPWCKATNYLCYCKWIPSCLLSNFFCVQCFYFHSSRLFFDKVLLLKGENYRVAYSYTGHGRPGEYSI